VRTHPVTKMHNIFDVKVLHSDMNATDDIDIAIPSVCPFFCS